MIVCQYYLILEICKKIESVDVGNDMLKIVYLLLLHCIRGQSVTYQPGPVEHFKTKDTQDKFCNSPKKFLRYTKRGGQERFQ